MNELTHLSLFSGIGGLDLAAERSERSTSGGAERNDDGIPRALDQLKAYGNAVVTQQFYPVFQAIADLERLTE